MANEKDTCPKCRSGLLFKDWGVPNQLHCFLCGYSESTNHKESNGGGKKAKGKLGQYMANYPEGTQTELKSLGIPVSYVPNQYPGTLVQTTKMVSLHTCSHNQVEIDMGGYKVWLSEMPRQSWERIDPDLGVYMAEVWLDYIDVVLTSGVTVEHSSGYYDTIFLQWGDRQGISLDILHPVVMKILEYIKAGKQVELGCHGGHGRTGTVAACVLAELEELTGTEAIEALRKRYCKCAVEGNAQIKLVKEYCETYVKSQG